MHPKSHKKPPTAMILGNEAFAPSEGASGPRDTALRTGVELRLRSPALVVHHGSAPYEGGQGIRGLFELTTKVLRYCFDLRLC